MVRQGILASSRHPAKGIRRLISSRSTQGGKEVFYGVVILPAYSKGAQKGMGCVDIPWAL